MRRIFLSALSITLLHGLAGCEGPAAATGPDAAQPADAADASLPRDLGAVANAADDLAVPNQPDLAVAPDLAGPYVPIDGGPNVSVVELISPALCRWQNGHLLDCQSDQVEITAPATTAVAPVRTEVQLKFSGKCSSTFPIARNLQADSDPPVFFDTLFPKQMLSLRRLDRGAISKVVLTDAYPQWTKVAAYDESCRGWLEITFNLPDSP